MGELQPSYEHHTVLIVASSKLSLEQVQELSEALRSAHFSSVQAIRLKGDIDGWPAGPNLMFRTAADHIVRNIKQPFLWLEPDAIPLSHGWLDSIEEEYRKKGKPFMGVVFSKPWPHMTGVAVYPPNIATYNPFMLGATTIPFDTVRPDLTLKNCAATSLLHHAWGDVAKNIPWTFPDAKSVARINEQAVVFHRCKDRTLIQRLRECRSRAEPTSARVAKAIARLSTRVEKAAKTAIGIKPMLKTVTLVCVDTIRPDLAMRAIKKCLDVQSFGGVKFFTRKPGVHNVVVPHIGGLAGYSNFLMNEVPNHIKTDHVLVVQWDGYILKPDAWSDEFLKYDYIGAISDMGDGVRRVGNGGFSLRSLKFMKACQTLPEPHHPEDQIICIRYRERLQQMGMKFAPDRVANIFSCEMSKYTGQYGFHSFKTDTPEVDRPPVFHHSGDWGDIIYGLPCIASAGGGVLYITPDIRTPMAPRQKACPAVVEAIAPLIRLQDYIWDCRYAPRMPESTDFDMNEFRNGYKGNTDSLFSKQLKATGMSWPENKPWLKADFDISIPQRPIVMHRCPRKAQYNTKFPWKALVDRWAHRAVGVGFPEEHDFLQSLGQQIPHIPTYDILNLARVISGCRVFVGSNSLPMALAIAMGKPCVQEVLDIDDNCRFDRRSMVYGTDENVEIPKSWL